MYGSTEPQDALSPVSLSTQQRNIETFLSARQSTKPQDLVVTMPVGKTLCKDPALALSTLVELMGAEVTVLCEPITNGKEAITIAIEGLLPRSVGAAR